MKYHKIQSNKWNNPTLTFKLHQISTKYLFKTLMLNDINIAHWLILSCLLFHPIPFTWTTLSKTQQYSTEHQHFIINISTTTTSIIFAVYDWVSTTYYGILLPITQNVKKLKWITSVLQYFILLSDLWGKTIMCFTRLSTLNIVFEFAWGFHANFQFG